MHIHFKRSGGFAGMRMEADVDTSELPPEEAEEWRCLVDEACFFELPEQIKSPHSPDRFNYEITVEYDDVCHSVEMGETSAPPEVQPLLSKLESCARRPGQS